MNIQHIFTNEVDRSTLADEEKNLLVVLKGVFSEFDKIGEIPAYQILESKGWLWDKEHTKSTKIHLSGFTSHTLMAKNVLGISDIINHCLSQIMLHRHYKTITCLIYTNLDNEQLHKVQLRLSNPIHRISTIGEMKYFIKDPDIIYQFIRYSKVGDKDTHDGDDLEPTYI